MWIPLCRPTRWQTSYADYASGHDFMRSVSGSIHVCRIFRATYYRLWSHCFLVQARRLRKRIHPTGHIFKTPNKSSKGRQTFPLQILQEIQRKEWLQTQGPSYTARSELPPHRRRQHFFQFLGLLVFKIRLHQVKAS